MKIFKKRILIAILCLFTMFALTGCDEDAPNFEYDKDLMISTSKSLVDQYYGVSELEKDYILSEGEDYMKDLVKGFELAKKTDKVGTMTGYNTSEDVVKFENGSNGTVICSIVAKFENKDADNESDRHRDVRVNITYKENKSYKLQKDSVTKGFTSEAERQGYTADEYAQLNGYKDAASFIDAYISQYYQITAYDPVECEVTAIYSTSELLVNGAKNMGVGMGIVFLVLIFIAFIISLLKFVPRLLGQEKKKDTGKKETDKKDSDKKTQPAVAAVKTEKPVLPQPPAFGGTASAVPEVGEEVEDTELIAVITAALHAYLSEGGATAVAHPPAYTASNDGLVVRSIRRVR